MENYRMILYLHHNVIANNDINERFSILGDTNIDKLTLSQYDRMHRKCFVSTTKSDFVLSLKSWRDRHYSL